MCLVLNKIPKNRPRRKTIVTRYKRLDRDTRFRTLTAPHRLTQYKIGITKSDRNGARLTATERLAQVVFHGIHVYTNKKIAQRHLCVGQVIVKVKCDLRKLVGGDGQGEQVYTEVELTNEEYQRVLPSLPSTNSHCSSYSGWGQYS